MESTYTVPPFCDKLSIYTELGLFIIDEGLMNYDCYHVCVGVIVLIILMVKEYKTFYLDTLKNKAKRDDTV
jgi:hypothetical protein